MSNVVIKVSNTSGISVGSEFVYAGKSGFTGELGVIYSIARSATIGVGVVSFKIDNLDKFHSIISGSSHISLPIKQFADSAAIPGTSGFTEFSSSQSLKLESINVSANTITVSGLADLSTVNLPSRIRFFEALLPSQNTAYISGSKKVLTSYANIVGQTGQIVIPLKVAPQLVSDIITYVDDTRISNLIWPNAGNASQVVIDLDSVAANIRVDVTTYTVPAVEVKDKIALATYGKNLTVTNTVYSNGLFKVSFDSNFSNIAAGSKFVNITPDLTGRVTNVTSNTFTITYGDDYPYTYNLANNKIYYAYDKQKVKYTSARLDEYGRISDLEPGNYIVKATNLNRYNRTSPTVTQLVAVEFTKLTKVQSISVEEQIFIDTTVGASITAVVSFPPIKGGDVLQYEVKYRILSEDNPDPNYSTLVIDNDESAPILKTSINNLTRGRVSGSNSLDLVITPLNNKGRGYPAKYIHSLIGKTNTPSGLNNLNVAQTDTNQLAFKWGFALTSDGYVLDLDTKEVEIREYKTAVDVSNKDTLIATWNISLPIARIPFPSSEFAMPISKFGTFTYLLRVRDTSDLESDVIVAATITTIRPSTIKVYKAYNEADPSMPFIYQNSAWFPNSNTDPESKFTSFSQGLNGGFVKPLASNTDNSNGSSSGFSVYSNTTFLTTTTNNTAFYITPIRDMGRIIRGSIRVAPVVSTATPGFIYGTLYDEIFRGVSDTNLDNTLLVDSAFGGIGHILGFSNTNAAPVSYNAFHKTLTSGGPYGNVFGLVSITYPYGSSPNVVSFSKIAGVINANTIRLGESYYSNGQPTGNNNSPFIARTGNAYALVDLAQYVDPRGSLTFLGPTSLISQNIYVRYSNANVFYSPASNGVVGRPGHGNVNPSLFTGGGENSELGWKNFIAGQLDFQYMQLKVELANKLPNSTEVILEGLTYEVDIAEKRFRSTIEVNDVGGVLVDYSDMGFVEPPTISATILTSNLSSTVSIFNKTSNSSMVRVSNAQSGLAVTTESVDFIATGI